MQAHLPSVLNCGRCVASTEQRPSHCHARAQDEQASSAWWMRQLGQALLQISMTPEPLLPWLKDVFPGGMRGVIVFQQPEMVRSLPLHDPMPVLRRSWG